MTQVENMNDFFELELNTYEGMIGETPIRVIFDESYAEVHGISGSDPCGTVRRSEVPVGTKIGDVLSIGYLQFRIRDRMGAGKDLVKFRLEAGPTNGGAFYRITAANLDIEEGWPDDITYYLTCVEDAYLMLPAKLDVSVLIAAGALEAVSASTPPSVLQLWYYRLGHATRDMDFAHDFGTPEHGYYMTVPLGSVIGLPGWRNVQAMVSSGLLVPINWP